jgi:catechol-2,3-dioxygenase
MKDFYVNILGLEFVSEEKDRYVFLKAGQRMLLIFNPNKSDDKYTEAKLKFC